MTPAVMSADTTPGDVVEFNGIKFSRTDCVFKGEHGQRIFRGSFKDLSSGLAPEGCEAAIIVFQKCDDADAVPPEAGQTFINRNFDRVISHERDALLARKGHTCENLHRYYFDTKDQQSGSIYIAAEPFVCTLANLVDVGILRNISYVTEDKTTKRKTFKSKQGQFEIEHTEKDISFSWNEQEKSYKFTISRKEIIRQIVNGVAFLHDHGIIHRNITPENIFVTYDKASRVDNQVLLKLSGFCLSKKAREDMSRSFSGSKTNGWSPQEMLKTETERITAAVDIFSLGCVMYHVFASGDHPFKKSEQNILCQSYTPRPPKHMEFSNEWFLIKRMISYNPKERPNIKEIKRSPALLDKDHYVIYHSGKKPGVCLIFNQESFPESKNPTREGSSLDAGNLVATFLLFGFECYVHKDLAAEEIRQNITEWSKTSGYQSIVVCVLSHGDESCILGADSAKLTYRELREIFADSSPTKNEMCFNGKPKIFIYQSCRGDQTQLSEKKSVPSSGGNLQNASAMAIASDDGVDSKPSCNGTPSREPALSDFLEVFSTIEGYKAYLTPNGSPFIRILCKRLEKTGDSEDFGSVVQLNDELQSWVAVNKEMLLCKQVSVMETCLSKCLRLERVAPH